MDLRRSWRDWAGDVCVTLAAAALGLFLLHASREDLPDGEDASVPRDVAIGAVTWVVLLLYRRRYPVPVTVAAAAAQVVSSTALGSAALAVFSLAIHRPWRTAVPVAAANMLLLSTVFWLASLSERAFREGVLTFGLAYAVLVTTGMLVRSRRQLIESLKERARSAEAEQLLRIEEARLLERERIAREMHDVLAHRISLLALQAGALEFRPDAPADQREAAGVIRRSAYEAMEDLREVIGVLRDDSPGADPERPQPTLGEVSALVEESRRAGARITLDDRVPHPAVVPGGVGRHAYRIVQEGLTNARKHAPGAHVQVTLDTADGAALTIEVVNPLPPGPPPRPLPGAGAGLVGLGERVALLGGTLEHGGTRDGRFRLRARLPCMPATVRGMGKNMPSESSMQPVLEELDRAECLRLIAPGGIGRVAFDDGEGPAVIPVNYAVDGESVIFRTSVSGRLNRSLPSVVIGGQVRAAFEADQIDETTRAGWSVLLRGGTHRLSDEEREKAVRVDPWPGGKREVWFRLTASDVSGRRLRSP